MPDSSTSLARIKAHEELCAERYRQIHETLGEMKDASRTQNRLIIGVLLAMVGWMGVQLWTGTAPHLPTQVQVQAR